MSIHFDTKRTLESLNLVEAGIAQAAGQSVRAAIQAAEKSEKSTTLFRDQTGGTRASIRGEYQGFGKGFVLAGGASRFLQSGTRAATSMRIVPMRINGQLLFRRFVHPGIQARPFVTEARAEAETALEQAASVFVSEAIRRA